MVCKDTLRIKHLPKELSDAQKEDFVNHFGAYKVKVITSKSKAKSVVYAKFENEDIAKNVMLRLHQINILNCRLCVEYAETDILQGLLLPTQKVEDIKDSPDKKFFRNFINNINAFNDSVGFYQPPPSHLKYNYPKANRPTINNIAHALATIPRFYTQVLHLMNKMNLPPPFAMPEPPVRSIPAAQITQSVEVSSIGEKRKALSSESEMESDHEDKSKEIVPPKRLVGPKKIIKRPKFIKQLQVQNVASKSTEKCENVFEKVDIQQQRKIELKVEQAEQLESITNNVADSKIKTKTKFNEDLILETNKKIDEIQDKIHPSLMSDIVPPTTKKLQNSKSKDISDITKPTQLVTPKLTAKEKPVDFKLIQSGLKEIDECKTNKLQTKATLFVINQEVKPLSHQEPNKDFKDIQKDIYVDSKVSNIQGCKSQSQNIVETDNKVETIIKVPEETLKIHQMGVLSHKEKAPIKTPTDQAPEEEFPYISLEELAANQITDLSSVAVFKNYNSGEPTNKLYIKNCAKTVVIQDLEYIYNRYREECTSENPSEFNIRLMQEGRMKGQAFVTLDSIELAERAVRETNGFILKDKPLIVVFGKTGKKK